MTQLAERPGTDHSTIGTHEDVGHFLMVRRDGSVELYQLTGRMQAPVRPVRCVGCYHLSGHEIPFAGRQLVHCRQGHHTDADGELTLYRVADLFDPPLQLAAVAAACRDFDPLERG